MVAAGVTVIVSSEAVEPGTEGQRARAAETPIGATRLSHGIPPLRRGLARDGEL